jgi:hypothetical protein
VLNRRLRCSIRHHNCSDDCDGQDACEQDNPKQGVFEDIEAVVHAVTSISGGPYLRSTGYDGSSTESHEVHHIPTGLVEEIQKAAIDPNIAASTLLRRVQGNGCIPCE